jgi:predicted N-formylglutamate amidohydrolase
VTLPWNRDLKARDLERRVMDYHAPYHNEIDRLILRRVVRGVRPVVFAVHSFTPVYDGRPRRFDVGILYEHHRIPARLIARHVRAAGFSVRYNQPYSGMAGMMYAVDRHGSHHGLPCLEIEINDALFARPARIRRLVAAVADGLRELTAS